MNKKTQLPGIIGGALLTLVQASAHSQDLGTQLNSQVGSEPGWNWRMGGEIGYDDNVFRTADPLADSDTYYAVSPELAWFGFRGANQFDVTASTYFRRYQEQDVLDFDSYRIRAHALLDHTARLTTDYTLGYEEGAQPLGEGGQFGRPGQSPNEFNSTNAGWIINYGAAEAAGQLEGSVRYSEQRFTNNNQEFRDSDNTQLTGIFYYRVAPRTRLLLQLDYNDFDFQNEDVFAFNQSGDELRYLGGVTWDATAKTSGEFKIGYRDRSFDAEGVDNLSGLALQLYMTWSPDELTSVRIGAREENQSSALQGVGGLERTAANLTVSRSVGPRTQLSADLRYDELNFAGDFGREDRNWTVSIGLEYSLLSRLAVGLEYRYEDRNSTADLFNFTANVVLLTFALAPPQ